MNSNLVSCLLAGGLLAFSSVFVSADEVQTDAQDQGTVYAEESEMAVTDGGMVDTDDVVVTEYTDAETGDVEADVSEEVVGTDAAGDVVEDTEVVEEATLSAE